MLKHYAIRKLLGPRPLMGNRFNAETVSSVRLWANEHVHRAARPTVCRTAGVGIGGSEWTGKQAGRAHARHAYVYVYANVHVRICMRTSSFSALPQETYIVRSL